MMKRRTLLSALAAASAAAALPSRAQQSHPKIVFGYTAVTDFASVFVAAEEGYFKKRGLDVELVVAAELAGCDGNDRGGVEEPLSFDDLVKKFRANCLYGGLTAPQTDAVLQCVSSLLDDTKIDLRSLRCA